MPTFTPAVVALPVADRHRAHAFYTSALELGTVGEPESDGLPEPLTLAVNDGLHLVLVPTDGFGWAVGDRAVAAPHTVECLLGVTVADDAAVDRLVRRATDAGADLVTAPGEQPWGYTGTVADPDGHLWEISAATTAPTRQTTQTTQTGPDEGSGS
ncbi:VOC family protein [Georgenia alba]|uniref:VOC family protein n=1 Tax=Georgenia alba TaxID=2233858 RepID=A0ABW2Q7P0_9MICO